ncbi:uncharacterized protein LOC119981050 [Tripterygium wilfordii]|uniref:uncharacterized protein LOC119981050 n=1 Tax=Tripterygium wilfordii TaxID=458696 RepID=UPI0018F864A8|nr:uncharacterized protein LOC119981050 [Tripterygium wilfordii]
MSTKGPNRVSTLKSIVLQLGSCMMNLPFDVSLRGLAWFPDSVRVLGGVHRLSSIDVFSSVTNLAAAQLLCANRGCPCCAAPLSGFANRSSVSSSGLLMGVVVLLQILTLIVAFCICHTTKCHRLCFPTEHHRYSEQGLSAGILREATYTAARLNIVKKVAEFGIIHFPLTVPPQKMQASFYKNGYNSHLSGGEWRRPPREQYSLFFNL